MNLMQFPSSFLLVLVVLGLIAWFITGLMHDFISKMFTPIEPEKTPTEPKEKIPLESFEAIYRDPITYKDYAVDVYCRGGKGNPKLMYYEDSARVYFQDEPPNESEGENGDIWIKKY